MTKEAYYFSHDSNARQDDKIVALRMKHGWEGYGLFWAIIEKLRDASDFSCVKDYNLIAFDLRTDAQKIKSIIEDFSLFEFEENRFFSSSLIARMNKREKSSLAGIKGNLIRYGHAKKEDLNNMTDDQIIELNNKISSPRPRPDSPPDRILKERKGNESKLKENELIEKSTNFKNLTKEEFHTELKEYVPDFGREVVSAFFSYWSEKNDKGKMKFQLQKTWETKLRLITWKNNESKWKN